MGKWLAAIAKGLSCTAGPFKPVVDLVLRLYDGELAEAADKTLQKMIVDQQDVLAEIVHILHEIRRYDGVLGEQLANGTEAFVELLRDSRIRVTSPEEIETAFEGPLIDRNLSLFWRNNFVCRSTVERECVEIYGTDIERFLVCVEGGGFSTAKLQTHAANDVIIRRCLRQTLGTNQYLPSVQASIVGELSRDAEGSAILKAAHQLLLLQAHGKG